MPSIHTVASNIDNASSIERDKHLNRLYEHTGRNVICYYSAFLNETEKPTGINDSDLHGFISTVHGLDKSKGLDLVLHTPGGDPAATESIVTYFRSIFGMDIRAIVPHMAMSAGTMLACSCKSIVMGKHSFLGPIDPQFGSGIPAADVIREFDKAKEELTENADVFPYWRIVLSQYPVGIYERACKSMELSGVLVKDWLKTNMLKNKPKAVNSVVKKLNENDKSKDHRRHFDKEQCREAGLVIEDLEADDELQDIVLSLHHCYMYTLGRTDQVKIIQNHKSTSVVSTE